MNNDKIQTLHPEIGKTNKVISLHKYEIVKEAMLDILAEKSLTHTQLMEAIHVKVKDTLAGNAQWYGETVKLDLEARKIIKRDNSKPQVYSLV
jgi:hypothetical protein